ncbi:MAG: SH3 domain-containing protein [Elainellaceae cyanobacterium]
MKRRVARIGISLGIVMGIIGAGCRDSQPQSREATPATSGEEQIDLSSAPTSVVRQALTQACQSEFEAIAQTSDTDSTASDFQINDYTLQPDGTFNAQWTTGGEDGGTCRVSVEGRVIALVYAPQATNQPLVTGRSPESPAASPSPPSPPSSPAAPERTPSPDPSPSPTPTPTPEEDGASGSPTQPGSAINPSRAALLAANEPGSRINVRSEPTTQSNAPHYGIPGDRVQVIREAEGAEGYTWYYVKFDSSGAEGWVREDFISFSL